MHLQALKCGRLTNSWIPDSQQEVVCKHGIPQMCIADKQMGSCMLNGSLCNKVNTQAMNRMALGHEDRTNSWSSHSQKELVCIHHLILKVHSQIRKGLSYIESLAHKVKEQIMPTCSCMQFVMSADACLL